MPKNRLKSTLTSKFFEFLHVLLGSAVHENVKPLPIQCVVDVMPSLLNRFGFGSSYLTNDMALRVFVSIVHFTLFVREFTVRIIVFCERLSLRKSPENILLFDQYTILHLNHQDQTYVGYFNLLIKRPLSIDDIAQ
jgi:hypothetical protein